MKKLFTIPILFAFAFSQSGNNQISYIIYTDTKSYTNVTLLSVIGKGLIVNEKKRHIENITFIYLTLIESK